MPKRRAPEPSFYGGLAIAGGALASGLVARIGRRPIDIAALVAASAASLIIVVNALFLQTGNLPTPVAIDTSAVSGQNTTATAKPAAPPVRQIIASNFPTVTPPASTSAAPAPGASAPLPASTTPTPPAAPHPAAAKRNDPIAALIGSSSRVRTVQRTLSDFGYGPISVTGVLDGPTSKAIENFERERKMPVTGRISDRLMTELGTLAGHPLE